jgi:hypothetical protein
MHLQLRVVSKNKIIIIEQLKYYNYNYQTTEEREALRSRFMITRARTEI